MQTMQRSLYEFKYKYRSRMLPKPQELRSFLQRKNTECIHSESVSWSNANMFGVLAQPV